MTYHERWKTLNERLRQLDADDLQEEPKLLIDAYDMLMRAYQESRSLNDEMQELVNDMMHY